LPTGRAIISRKAVKGIAEIGRSIASLSLPTLVVMEGGYNIESLGENVANLLAAFVSS